MFSLPISNLGLPVLIGYRLKPNKQSSSSRTNTTLGTLILLGALMSLGGLSVAAPVTRLVSTQAGTEPELLEPERAFQLSARKKTPLQERGLLSGLTETVHQPWQLAGRYLAKIVTPQTQSTCPLE